MMILAAGAVLMFTLTGAYLQMAFNLANRVTIFGAALVVTLVAATPLPPRAFRILWLASILVVLGIADHWKRWDAEQAVVISRMQRNTALQQLAPGTAVYVSGHQYSQYGPFSHIEFLSEDWVANAVLRLASAKDLVGHSMNPRLIYTDGTLVDRKYGSSAPIGSALTLYDSVRDEVRLVDAEEVPDLLTQLPAERRHWIQFIEPDYVRRVVVWFAPRLDYLFQGANQTWTSPITASALLARRDSLGGRSSQYYQDTVH
jgi:hypothetical protein